MKILKGSLKEKEVTGREIKYNDARWPECSIRDNENKYFKVPVKDCEIVSEEHKNTILKSAGWGTFGLVAGGLKVAPVAICPAATGVFKGIRSKVVSAVLTLEDDTML